MDQSYYNPYNNTPHKKYIMDKLKLKDQKSHNLYLIMTISVFIYLILSIDILNKSLNLWI